MQNITQNSSLALPSCTQGCAHLPEEGLLSVKLFSYTDLLGNDLRTSPNKTLIPMRSEGQSHKLPDTQDIYVAEVEGDLAFTKARHSEEALQHAKQATAEGNEWYFEVLQAVGFQKATARQRKIIQEWDPDCENEEYLVVDIDREREHQAAEQNEDAPTAYESVPASTPTTTPSNDHNRYSELPPKQQRLFSFGLFLVITWFTAIGAYSVAFQ